MCPPLAQSHSVQMTLLPLNPVILVVGDHSPLVFLRDVEVGLAPGPIRCRLSLHLSKLHPQSAAMLCLVAQSSLTLCNPWPVACQASLSMEFFKQEYWSSGLPFPSPGNLRNPGIKPGSPALQGDSYFSMYNFSRN